MSRVLTYLLIVFTAVFVTGCAEDGDKVSYMSESAFASLFPNYNVGKWVVEPGYEIARFTANGTDAEAWFDHNGWIMTVWAMTPEKLPQHAQNSLASNYRQWETVALRRLDRKELATVYVATVERNKVVYDLYFAENGMLVRKSDETNAKQGAEKYLPAPKNDAVEKKMDELYPDAVVYNCAVRSGAYAICFVSSGNAKTALFSTDGEWLLTSTPMSGQAIGKAVADAVEKQMPGSKISDLTLTETPSNSFYSIECRTGDGTTQMIYMDKK